MSESFERRLRDGLQQAADFEPNTEQARAVFNHRRARRRTAVRLGGAAVAALTVIFFLAFVQNQDVAGDADEGARQFAAESPSPRLPGGSGGSGGGDGVEGGGGGAAGGSGAYAGAATGGGDGGAGEGGDGGAGDSGDATGGAGDGGDIFSGTAGGSSIPNVPPAAGKVIKNSNLEIRVEDGTFERQFGRASALAERLGGFVSNSSVTQGEEDETSGSLILRVPSANFQDARTRLKELGKVEAESQTGQDVGKEFVDLEARLRHAKVQETFFLKLLDQAKGIGELVQVQQQLANVQLQIEQIQGQLQYLTDQTSYSTVRVLIFEPGAEIKSPETDLSKAVGRSVNAFQSVVGGLVVTVGWLAPFLLIGGLFLFVRRLRRSK